MTRLILSLPALLMISLWLFSAAQAQTFSGFTLINARQDKVIQPIHDGDIISLNEVNLYDFNIRAESGSFEFTKVVFQLTGPVNVSSEDNDPEFLVFGVAGQQAIAGSYTLTATPYYLNSGNEEVAGPSLSKSFIFSSIIHVNNVRLVSSADGSLVEKFRYNGTNPFILDKAKFPVTGINILADVTSAQHNSLYFELSGPVVLTKLENSIPFSLFGDTNGRLLSGSLAEGDYQLTITPYLGKNKTGFAGKPFVVPFKVIDQLRVSNLRLIDATTGFELIKIQDADTLDPQRLPTEELNIIADVPNPNINSVLFELEGPVSITKLQNESPYAVFGDDNGVFYSQQLPKGDYTLTATTYRLANQKGKAGEPVTIHFTKKFDPAPPCGTINAGDDIIACGYREGGELNLQATPTNHFDSITWSTNGLGGFDDPHSLNPTYFYDPSDVNIANIEIYATIENASCGSYTDTVSVYFQAAPYLEFPEPFVQQNGTDPVFAGVNLYGYASSGTWSTTGSGTFSDPNSTFTSYYPSTADATSGCAELIFTSNDPDGDCVAAIGSMTACFNPPCPEISIGEDITICGYQSGGAISLQATVSGNFEGISWGTNGAGGFDDPNSFTPTYYYDATDVNNAQIEIQATISNFGCSASDVLTVYLQAAPEMDFPLPTVYGCSGSTVYANVYLYGYASGGIWTTTGTGTFEDPTSTYTAYNPGSEDAGCITFTFTTNDPEGPCSSASGTMEACFEDCAGTSTSNASSVNNQDILVYPNPSEGQIELKTKVKIKKAGTYITDIGGAKVDFSWSGETIIISDLLSGPYILHTLSEEGKPYIVHFIKL